MKKRRIQIDLKKRIFLAFFAVILSPVILMIIAFTILMNMNLKNFGQEFGVEHPTYESLYNNTYQLSFLMDDQFRNLQTIAQETPGKLEDNAFLNLMNEEIGEDNGYLVIRKNDDIYYNGSTRVSDGQLLEILPAYVGESVQNEGLTLYLQSLDHSLIRQSDFEFPDGAHGSMFIVIETDRIAPGIKAWMTELILILMIVLVMTSLLVTLWIYHGIAAPLNGLSKAAKNIRDGNLDFKVDGCHVREINDLCEDFEAMRIRLKESAEEKVTNDQGSKELISNISHDLKTPITAVKGYVEGIMDGVADTPEKMDRYIRTIYNKTVEMDRLINELTFYSKINTNRIPYTFTKIPVSDYFQDCVEELQLDLSAQNIELTYYNYLTEDVLIIADAEQLKRVINNLISNCVKYMNKPRKLINIRIRDVGDFVQVEVEDNGKGIAQKDLPKIFDRFYRTDASRNSTRGGSGIGLSIVRKIMEDHGGKVWATSKEDVGTVMYFVLRKYQEVPTSAENTNH